MEESNEKLFALDFQAKKSHGTNNQDHKKNKEKKDICSKLSSNQEIRNTRYTRIRRITDSNLHSTECNTLLTLSESVNDGTDLILQKDNSLNYKELTVQNSSKLKDRSLIISPNNPIKDNKNLRRQIDYNLTSNHKESDHILNQSPIKRGLNFKIMKERLNLSFESNLTTSLLHNRSSSLDSSSSLSNHSYETNNHTYGSINSLSPTDVTDQSISTEQEENFSMSNNIFEQYYKEFRDSIITKELVLLSQNHQDGVFVIPSIMSLQVWFGVIFIRDGPYKDGIFHFTIYFKDNYPETIPIIRFRSRVFHPQIEQRKGTLNICLDNTNIRTHDEKTKKKLRKQIIHVWQILKYLRSCFYHLDTSNAVNHIAGTMFESGYQTFLLNCRESVRNALYAYEEQNYEDDNIIENPLKGCLVSQNIVYGFKHYLPLQNNNQNYGAVDNMISWAKQNLGKLLNNLNTYGSDQTYHDS